MRFLKENELIARFMAMNIGSGIAVGMVNFILPLFSLSLDATTAEIGLIKGMMGVGDILIVLPAGFLIDYFGTKKMYTVACLFGSFMILVMSFAQSPTMLLGLMIFYGISRSLRTTSLNASFFSNMNAIGIRKGGWFKGAMTAGAQFIGPLIGGFAIIFLTYPGYFVLASAFLLVPLVVLYLSTNGEKSSDTGPKLHLWESLRYYRNLLKNKLLVSATLTECMNSACFMTFSTFVTVLIVVNFELSPSIAAILIALRGIAQILVVIFCGRLLYENHNNLYFISYIMIIISLLLFGTNSNIIILAAAAVIMGSFSGLMTLLTFTNVGSIEGERGKIAGIFAIGTSIGAIFGPVYGGFIGDTFGVQNIFLGFIPLFVTMACFYLFIGRKQNIAGNISRTIHLKN
ncbi:MFS transporter [Methanosphaerula palustris]|uniref:Major facilitator superfamily MFS_1 n=1 Tax=Methanosphaerula palustris (strain ATCC BAA-1556 / DSM 19958 / E1-9c) TaxID=521011 RepID=B8GH69_METPE|nr:MFS transporter [Methanosphaerula palustris]ACL16474.1 major facilitator superfamily MFS_1 [Methanosphaerula palustris E1-9c]